VRCILSSFERSLKDIISLNNSDSFFANRPGNSSDQVIELIRKMISKKIIFN